jgi:hypothetical protein
MIFEQPKEVGVHPIPLAEVNLHLVSVSSMLEIGIVRHMGNTYTDVVLE